MLGCFHQNSRIPAHQYIEDDKLDDITPGVKPVNNQRHRRGNRMAARHSCQMPWQQPLTVTQEVWAITTMKFDAFYIFTARL